MENGLFDQRDVYRTLALEVEGRWLWVSRETLAIYSPVFKAMLYGEFEEANRIVIPLPGKKVADIATLLKYLHHPLVGDGQKIHAANFDILMDLADEYLIDTIKEKVERYLVVSANWWRKGDTTLLGYLLFGAHYRLTELMEKIIPQCAVRYTMDQLRPVLRRIGGRYATQIVEIYLLRSRQCDVNERRNRECSCCGVEQNRVNQCTRCKKTLCGRCVREYFPTTAFAQCSKMRVFADDEQDLDLAIDLRCE